jgi:hypothetical protein
MVNLGIRSRAKKWCVERSLTKEAASYWLLAKGGYLLRVATLSRPNSWNEKTRLKLTAIGALKNVKNGYDRSVIVRSNWG